MKRFHVHLSVPAIDESVRFYSAMFGAEPSVRKDDYAKWLLDDPAVNFAISARGATHGVNHLGLQVESDEQLQALRTQAEAADMAVLTEDGASCCYARSDKHWITDPAGVAWESFHSLGDIPVFGEDTDPAAKVESAGASVCCPPQGEAPKPADEASRGCCG